MRHKLLFSFLFSIVAASAQASPLEAALEKLFGKFEARSKSWISGSIATERAFEIKDSPPHYEIFYASMGVVEASINGAEPNGISAVGLVDLDNDGLEEMLLVLSGDAACSSAKRCQILIYKPIDSSKKKYRRIYSATHTITAGKTFHAVSRGAGKLRAIEARADGRLIDRIEP
jgi:hypothetical protein